MSKPHAADGDLYVVFLDRPAAAAGIVDDVDIRKLGETLYLVRWPGTQSQLYHAIKRRTRPEALFVARLDGDPKFKGMNPGALKWLRAAG